MGFVRPPPPVTQIEFARRRIHQIQDVDDWERAVRKHWRLWSDVGVDAHREACMVLRPPPPQGSVGGIRWRP